MSRSFAIATQKQRQIVREDPMEEVSVFMNITSYHHWNCRLKRKQDGQSKGGKEEHKQKEEGDADRRETRDQQRGKQAEQGRKQWKKGRREEEGEGKGRRKKIGVTWQTKTTLTGHVHIYVCIKMIIRGKNNYCRHLLCYKFIPMKIW